MSSDESIEILLVEDDPTDALLAREILEEARQFHLGHAERLSNALEMLSSGRYDVVLLDLGLPDSQGLSTLVELRKRSPYVPVVVMTGRDDEDLALQAVQEGAQDYLVKNLVQEGVLRRAIRYAIERHQSESALRERAMLAALAADVGLALASSASLPRMLTACAETIRRDLGAALVRIWMPHETSGDLELQASAGASLETGDLSASEPAGRSELRRISEEKRPYVTGELLDDSRAEDREWLVREGVIAFSGFPLVLEDRALGVMEIYSHERFSPATLEALASVANHIALGIERKRAEADLYRSEQQYRLLFESNPRPMWVFDRETLRFLAVNDAAVHHYGYSRDEFLAMTIMDVRPSEDVPRLLETLQADRKLNYAGTWRHVRKDGSVIDVEVVAHAIDFGGRNARLALLTDVTERMQGEASRRHLEEQLRQAQKMEAIGSLAGGVAHDFNNLLTIISGYSAIIQRQLPPGDPIQDLVGEISQAGIRAASLTRQLLAFSRKQILEPKVVNLNDRVLDVEKLLSRLIGEDVDLACALDPSLGDTRADAGQIEQVILNLAINARDAMPRGGRLTIETRNVELDETYTRAFEDLRPGRYVMLAVTDTGTGMDEATKARIFEPFFTTKEAGKGTGLGLATVYGIVKQSEGHIAVYSEPGHGTSFKVYLPRIEGEGNGEREDSDSPPAAVVGTETILLVEDEASLRALARHILTMHGYEVLDAGNGQEAITLAEAHQGTVHLLVTDVVMPEMGGSLLSARLQALHPNLKVLYMSGYTDDAVVRHGILHAETAFLQKPFSPDALARKVRDVLDRE
jgi:PAS domain S-box-containing protein